jgi:hypothetical protein
MGSLSLSMSAQIAGDVSRTLPCNVRIQRRAPTHLPMKTTPCREVGYNDLLGDTLATGFQMNARISAQDSSHSGYY